jgi:hypothetical protein
VTTYNLSAATRAVALELSCDERTVLRHALGLSAAPDREILAALVRHGLDGEFLDRLVGAPRAVERDDQPRLAGPRSPTRPHQTSGKDGTR